MGVDAAGRGGGDGPRIRDHLANVRTLLAWVRAGLAAMALGYSLDRLGLLEAGGRTSRPYRGAGIVLVCLGTVAVALALLSYLGQRTAIETAPIRTHLPAWLMITVAVGTGALGLGLVVLLVR